MHIDSTSLTMMNITFDNSRICSSFNFEAGYTIVVYVVLFEVTLQERNAKCIFITFTKFGLPFKGIYWRVFSSNKFREFRFKTFEIKIFRFMSSRCGQALPHLLYVMIIFISDSGVYELVNTF